MNIKNRFIFAILLGSNLIVMDFFTNLFFHNFYIESSKFTMEQIGLTFLLSFLISFAENWVRVLISSLLILLSTVEIAYFSFFRGLIQPYHLKVVWSEMEDILDSIYSILPILIALSILFALSIFVIIRVSYRIGGGVKYINRMLLLIFSSLPILAHFKPHSLTVSPLNFSYINMIYTISIALEAKVHTSNNEKFAPYHLSKGEPKEQNILVIMGESLSSKRMHLFGYNKNNTPNLDKLKENSNFFYGKALSSGVNTPVSIVSFFTLKREPTNKEILIKQHTNLLRLANQSGYTTAWFSMQNEGMSISSILKYASTIKFRKDYPKWSYDEVLLEDLKGIDWRGKNFIVLHFRANHSPYEKYIPPKFRLSNYSRLEYHKYKIGSYSDSVTYIDHLLSKIFQYMLKTESPFKIYFTSDHGERLGYKDDNFKYGHSELDFEVAKVPLLIFSDRKLELKELPFNHYQIGKMILNDLGYTLYNPNDDNSTYFINGLSRDGASGFLKYSDGEK